MKVLFNQNIRLNIKKDDKLHGMVFKSGEIKEVDPVFTKNKFFDALVAEGKVVIFETEKVKKKKDGIKESQMDFFEKVEKEQETLG